MNYLEDLPRRSMYLRRHNLPLVSLMLIPTYKKAILLMSIGYNKQVWLWQWHGGRDDHIYVDGYNNGAMTSMIMV